MEIRLDVGNGIVANDIRDGGKGGTDEQQCLGWLHSSDDLLV